MRQEALRAAADVGKTLSLPTDAMEVIAERSNVIIRYRPAPVVARLAGITTRVRTGDDWLRREIAVARYLADLGAPIVPPAGSVPAGPYAAGGLTLTLWAYAPSTRPPDPASAGRALQLCHEALRGYDGDLIELGLFAEARAMLSHMEKAGAVTADESRRLHVAADRLQGALGRVDRPRQAVHGDAHLNNVIWRRQPLWNDWEDVCAAPVEWDLACLVSAGRVAGRRGGEGEAALAAYGGEFDPAALEVCLGARTFQATMWGFIFNPDPGRRPDTLLRRIGWLQERWS